MSIDEVVSKCDALREKLEGCGLSDVGVELVRYAYRQGKKSMLDAADTNKLDLAEVMMSVTQTPAADDQAFAEFCSISEGFLEDLYSLSCDDDGCECRQSADYPENLISNPCVSSTILRPD